MCLVIGTIGNVLSVHDFLGEKIQESFPGDVLRARQIKLLIPNGTAGVIIGKGGSTIENIKQDTTASLTITPKSEMPERVMTITGTFPTEIFSPADVLSLQATKVSGEKLWKWFCTRSWKILITIASPVSTIPRRKPSRAIPTRMDRLIRVK